MEVTYYAYAPERDFPEPFLCRGAKTDDVAVAPDAARVRAYPNPATTTVRLDFSDAAALDGGGSEVEIFNLRGQVVLTHPLTAAEAEIHSVNIGLINLPAGFYTYRLRTVAQVYVGKFIKQ